jgi:hypothetical protein
MVELLSKEPMNSLEKQADITKICSICSKFDKILRNSLIINEKNHFKKAL